MRGGQHRKYLKNLEEISKICSSSHENWKIFYKDVKRIGNLGISTITKLAYFYGLKFNDSPALILDKRIIDVLANEHWEELKKLFHITYSNAASKSNYDDYLKTMKRVATDLNVKEAQLEFFLFSMGKAFD